MCALMKLALSITISASRWLGVCPDLYQLRGPLDDGKGLRFTGTSPPSLRMARLRCLTASRRMRAGARHWVMTPTRSSRSSTILMLLLLATRLLKLSLMMVVRQLIRRSSRQLMLQMPSRRQATPAIEDLAANHSDCDARRVDYMDADMADWR